MRVLDRLLGDWEFTMQHPAVAGPVSGRQRYEWVLDGAFILQYWTYAHPDFPDAMALLSHDQYHYFDVRGIVRIFELQINVEGWSMIHLDPDFAQRSTSRFQERDILETTGEQSQDGGVSWQSDFAMICRRLN
ncbi:hypothetical protein [Deinococcus sonorensis]|uniref:DUF1579 domain-containing protein n=2 Tax=Deinococcus sonorensis TaxID=309891 RepID=A0AAU7U9Q7_9DEIO